MPTDRYGTYYPYYVQSAQVRGERRSYWVAQRNLFHDETCLRDFGTNKHAAQKYCDGLNAKDEKPAQRRKRKIG